MARIKKIMQTDEEVGKVAAPVPVIISRALEMFIETLIVKTGETTQARNAKTLTATHIKQTIQSEKKFDFLRDLVAAVPDIQVEEDGESSNHCETKKQKRPRKQKEKSQKRGRKKKTSESSEDNDHTHNNGDNTIKKEPVDEDEDDEDTETDEDNHSSESHDQTYTSPNSSGLAQTFSPPTHMPHCSQSFVPPPYGHVNNLLSAGHMMPPNQFVPLMPPFPSSGFPPPLTIDETNQPLDLCTTSSKNSHNSYLKSSIRSAISNSTDDDDYDT